MALALEHRPVRHASRTRHAGSPSHPLRDTFERIVSAWRRYRIARELEGLSFDQRKDIGFRSSDKTTR
ncbi:hypothetical protein [Shinella sp. HZN7]|jgi:uncharacterized protein YjiS (DUF1127 family)|uniref:hypothetical protein n=1 Tax=Shinella sp. (strain HZN7) TaxID=879274 RepID=UPI000A5514A7|nr:hypothetical protein [Shinella sp. HZN7]